MVDYMGDRFPIFVASVVSAGFRLPSRAVFDVLLFLSVLHAQYAHVAIPHSVAGVMTILG